MLVPLGCEPPEDDYDDIAAALGSVTAGDPGTEVEMFKDCSHLTRGHIPNGMHRDAYGRYVGPRGMMEVEYTARCYDFFGALQPHCDDMTDAADIHTHANGMMMTPHRSGSVGREGTWELRDLLSATFELNGDVDFHIETTFERPMGEDGKSYDLSIYGVYRDLRIRASDHRIVSGSMELDVHVRRTAERHYENIEWEYDVSAEITFNGTGDAALALDDHRKYQLDLASGDTFLKAE